MPVPFKKGNPGGPGRPKGSLSWKDAIKRHLKAAAGKGKTELDEVILSLITEAKKGDTRAARFLAEYSEGKPSEHLRLTGEDGGPIEFTEVVQELKRQRGKIKD